MVAGVPSHQVQGVAVDAPGRHELAHGRGPAVGAAHHGEEQVGVTGVEDPSEHHGEAALVLALPAEAHQGGELGGERRVEVARIVERGRVAVLRDAVVGLAESFHRPTGQGEGLHPHHGLVPEVDVVHPRVAVDRQPVLAGAHDRRHPAVAVGEPSERPPHLLALVPGTDRVRRDEAHPPVDGVGHQAVPVEEPLLVRPQGEVVERGDAVAPHDVPGPVLGGPPRGQSPVDHRAGQEEQGQGHDGQADGQQRRGEEAVGHVGEPHRPDADQALGHRPQGRPPRDVRVVMAADVDEQLDGGRGDQGDPDQADGEGHQGRAERGPVRRGLEVPPVDHQEDQDGRGRRATPRRRRRR